MGKKPRTKMILDALTRTGGNVSATAQVLGVTRRSVYMWMAKDPKLREAQEDAKESLIDMAENKLFQAVKNGDMTAIIFTLKTIGKERGYMERQQLDFGKEADITISYTKNEE